MEIVSTQTKIYKPEFDTNKGIFYDKSPFKKYERGILWNDKDVGINWGIKKPIISAKDKKNKSFKYFK